MLKSLFPGIDWDVVKYVGFDMDGTLYDELDFIKQVYKPIATRIAQTLQLPAEDIYRRLLERWVEKGSSYNRIFDEMLTSGELSDCEREDVIKECLQIFRNYFPVLTLTNRVSFLLHYLHPKYELFLITDGGAQLQKSKFHALGLSKWFKEENIGFTGLYGSAFNKPSSRIASKIKILQGICDPKQVVFFGDREIDEKFARGLGYQFVLTHCMQKEGGSR